MSIFVPVALAAGASALTTAWHQLAHRERESSRHQAMCSHVWGEVREVARHPYGYGPHYYRQWCKACPAQRSVNADGSEYVPGRLGSDG